MADVAPARENILIEEVDFNSSISEAVEFKKAGSINFINDFQTDSHAWIGNGPATLFKSLIGLDAEFTFPFNATIVAMTMFFKTKTFAGAGSTKLEYDIIKVTTPGTAGATIFSTLPAIDDTSPNTNSYFVYNFTTSTFTKDVTGSVAPVLSGSADVNAGDLLLWNITESITSLEDFSMRIFYRPR